MSAGDPTCFPLVPAPCALPQGFVIDSGMKELLIEWRDAREAIFNTPVDKNVTPAQFARLGNAEDKLMQLARTL